MTPRFGVVGLVVEDMSRSLAFYRRLGLDLPAEADGQPHVQASLPGDLSIAWDTVDTIGRSIRRGRRRRGRWSRPAAARLRSNGRDCQPHAQEGAAPQ